MQVGARDLGWGVAWLAAGWRPRSTSSGNIGGVGAWLTGPARVAFVIGLDRYFPPAFGRVHPKWQTPYVAILTQAVLATVFLLLSVLGKGTTVEKAYLVILDTMLLVYFIPYIYLFVCYLRRAAAKETETGRSRRARRADSAARFADRCRRSGPHAVRDDHRDRAAVRNGRPWLFQAQGDRRRRLLRRARRAHLLAGTRKGGEARRAGASRCGVASPLAICALGLLACRSPVAAQRAPVLQQIKVRHPYYYREMFIPQVTSGPSSVAWSPDGTELVYSMQGSLWRQRVGSTEARQLTDGPGYDYQPDWSPDGRRIVYASYRDDAIELRLLDLATGQSRSARRRRRGEPGAALVARRQAARLHVLDRTRAAGTSSSPMSAPDGRARQRPADHAKTARAASRATTTTRSTSTSRRPGRPTARS